MKGFFTEEPPMVIHDWLKQRISLPWSTDFRGFARVVDGKIIGVVGYEGFTGTSCRIHMAGEGNWINREFIKIAFDYPFKLLDLPMVLATVPSGNKTALKIDKKLGFVELLFIEGAHPDGGVHVLQLTRDNWMRTKYGRQSSRST